MNSLHFKTKINNSYESEPSSGSSVSAHHECITFEEEIRHLPTLLRPRLEENETETCNETTAKLVKKRSSEYYPKCERRSIEESPFRGFSEDTSFDQSKLQVFGTRYEQLSTHSDPSVAKLIFPKFYDIIMDENSCNAVDIPQSNPNNSQQNCPNNSKEIESEILKNLNPNDADKLSFNGKILSLCDVPEIKNESDPKVIKEDEATSVEERTPTLSPQRRLQRLLESSLIGTGHLNESLIFKHYSNEKSPDLFDEGDVENVSDAHDATTTANVVAMQPTVGNTISQIEGRLASPTMTTFVEEQTLDPFNTTETERDLLLRDSFRREREMLQRIRKSLAGVPPPPAMTIPQINICTEVLQRKYEILNFFIKPENGNHTEMLSTPSKVTAPATTSLLKPTHTLDAVRCMMWKDVLGVRQHGLSFNLNQASESNEYLS